MCRQNNPRLPRKAHFIFAVGVLVEEFARGFFLRVVGAQADHIPALIAFLRDQLVDGMLVSVNDHFWGSGSRLNHGQPPSVQNARLWR